MRKDYRNRDEHARGRESERKEIARKSKCCHKRGKESMSRKCRCLLHCVGLALPSLRLGFEETVGTCTSTRRHGAERGAKLTVPILTHSVELMVLVCRVRMMVVVTVWTKLTNWTGLVGGYAADEAGGAALLRWQHGWSWRGRGSNEACGFGV
jgi:hypothetical protein